MRSCRSWNPICRFPDKPRQRDVDHAGTSRIYRRCRAEESAGVKQLPQTVVVLDAGGHLVAAKREDGSGIIRFEVAVGKAYGALGMGWGSSTMMERAAQNPNFLTSIAAASGGRVVPAPGGLLIRDGDGAVIGAVGISGDAGENDEVSAVAGIEAAGLKADPGGTKK